MDYVKHMVYINILSRRLNAKTNIYSHDLSFWKSWADFFLHVLQPYRKLDADGNLQIENINFVKVCFNIQPTCEIVHVLCRARPFPILICVSAQNYHQ